MLTPASKPARALPTSTNVIFKQVGAVENDPTLVSAIVLRAAASPRSGATAFGRRGLCKANDKGYPCQRLKRKFEYWSH
jgi:hypothetical protein